MDCAIQTLQQISVMTALNIFHRIMESEKTETKKMANGKYYTLMSKKKSQISNSVAEQFNSDDAKFGSKLRCSAHVLSLFTSLGVVACVHQHYN